MGFIGRHKEKRVPVKSEKAIEKRIAKFWEERRFHHDRRIELHFEYKARWFEKDTFLGKKKEVLKTKEEYLVGIKIAQLKLDELSRTQDCYREYGENFNEYYLINKYDADVVNNLVYKVLKLPTSFGVGSLS